MKLLSTFLCVLMSGVKIDISDVETPQPDHDLSAEISHRKLYTIQNMQFSTCMMSIGNHRYISALKYSFRLNYGTSPENDAITNKK